MFCSRRNVNIVSDVDFISMLRNVQNGQICQLSLRNRLAVARGMAVIIVSKTASSIHSKQFLYKQNLSNLILFTCFRIAKFAAA